jgi:DNA-binding transcriptional regulator YiaG
MKKKRTTKRPDLKVFRERRGLTQQDVAHQLGVDASTVWRWENWGLPGRGLALRELDRFFESNRRRRVIA